MTHEMDGSTTRTMSNERPMPKEVLLREIRDLAEAALTSLEPIKTDKLAAKGFDQDAYAVGQARIWLDRLVATLNRQGVPS